MTREKWLKLAEVVDSLRIFPRLLLLGYCYYAIHVGNWILMWYMALPAAERSMEASGLAFGVFSAVTGLCGMFMKTYVNSGRKWNGSVPHEEEQ